MVNGQISNIFTIDEGEKKIKFKYFLINYMLYIFFIYFSIIINI